MRTWRWVLLAFPLVMTFGIQPTFAEGGLRPARLFLLAGATTRNAPVTYPVTLYTVGPGRKLQLVRQVVGAEAGMMDVRPDLGDKIYVSYPHIVPTTVSVIHMRQPLLIDDVDLNPKRILVSHEFPAVAAGKDLQSSALYLEFTPDYLNTTLVSVSGDRTNSQPRVATDQWAELESLRYGGCPGGPSTCAILEATVMGNEVFIDEPPHRVAVSPAPPSLAPTAQPQHVQVVAASPRFFILGPWYSVKALASGAIHATPLYVHDRSTGGWEVVKLQANTPRSRLFGAWLATIVENWNPNNSFLDNAVVPGGDNNPGQQNERDQGTALLPSVAASFDGANEGGWHLIPGILILNNLATGGKITIQTNQEDSEIIDVRRDGLVLYRVNDSIYSAQIEGDKLSAPTLVVKDEDVPEVHWAFWSNAEVKAQPAAAGAHGR